MKKKYKKVAFDQNVNAERDISRKSTNYRIEINLYVLENYPVIMRSFILVKTNESNECVIENKNVIYNERKLFILFELFN